jgi:hypothetical protein
MGLLPGECSSLLRRRPIDPTARIVSRRPRLEEDLQRKLHVEGLARADAGITEKRSDRRADLTGFAGERPTAGARLV